MFKFLLVFNHNLKDQKNFYSIILYFKQKNIFKLKRFTILFLSKKMRINFILLFHLIIFHSFFFKILYNFFLIFFIIFFTKYLLLLFSDNYLFYLYGHIQ